MRSPHPLPDIRSFIHSFLQNLLSKLSIPGLRDRQRNNMIGFMEFAPKREVKMSVYLIWQFQAGEMAQ